MIGLEQVLRILYAQAGYGGNRQAQISVLSAQVLMNHMVVGGRGCLFCLHLPALRYPSPHLSRLDKETTGRDGDRSAALKITLALPFPHQMQMGTPAHYTP